jgi:hypothetical protein
VTLELLGVGLLLVEANDAVVQLLPLEEMKHALSPSIHNWSRLRCLSLIRGSTIATTIFRWARQWRLLLSWRVGHC